MSDEKRWFEAIKHFPSVALDDEWLHLLQGAVNELLGGTVGSFKGTRARLGPGVPDFELHVDKLGAWLRIAEDAGNLRAFVVGDGASLQTEIDIWNQAAALATQRLRPDFKDWAWYAIIGPQFGNAADVLIPRETRVGPLELKPAPESYREEPLASPPRLGPSGATLHWWPTMVEGISPGPRDKDARMHASRQLHRLCGLLAVAFDSPIVVRQVPMPCRAPLVAGMPAFQVRAVPPWLDRAWTRLESNDDLAQAVTAYHEATRLYREHPSFALVAFVAAIEACAKVLPRPSGDAPKKCPTCQREPNTAAADFRRALGEVIDSPEEVKAVAKIAYRQRSQTAHEGVLHGIESLPGFTLQPVLIGSSPETDFAWMDVRMMRGPAQRLLVKLLSQ